MIRLYAWHTSNGRKVSVMLEELGLAYEIVKMNLAKGEQFAPEFTALSPNQKIPAIVDGALALAESGAILVYLAEKTGKLLAPAGAARYQALQWLMFQMAHIGPMLGQAHHFRLQAKEKLPYAIERYEKEADRLYRGARRLPGAEALDRGDRRAARGPARNGSAEAARLSRYCGAGCVSSSTHLPPRTSCT